MYGFGAVSIVVDSTNMAISAQMGSRWVPISLQDLVAEHQKRTAARR